MDLKISFNYKKIISEEHLSNINGVCFTSRELDIVSALIHNRGEKKIASLLDISPKTVSAHVYNITRKISCSSREQVVDFIEKSGKLLYLKQYYINILIANLFKNYLDKIFKIQKNNETIFFLEHSKLEEKEESLLKQLKIDLKLVNIILIDTVKNSVPHGTAALKRNDVKNIKNKSESIAIIFAPNPNYDFNANVIDFSREENYYNNVFILIGKLLNNPDIENLKEAFIKECDVYKSSWHGHSQVGVGNLLNTINPINKEKFLSKKNIRVLSVLALGFTTLILCFLYFKPAERIISDLPLPHEKVLLNRNDFLDEIDKKLLVGSGIKVAALVGVGGSGKTTIARQYARNKSFKIIWEINAETKESLIASFEKLASALSHNHIDSQELEFLPHLKNQDERNRRLFSFITRKLKSYSDWLIIYNDMTSFSDIKTYFPYDAQVWGAGKVIITTRDSNIGHNYYIPTTSVIQVNELSNQEKNTLFNKILQDSSATLLSKENYSEIIKKLPPFPLDLSLAAYYIKAEKINSKNYLKYLSVSEEGYQFVQEIILNNIGEYNKTRFEIITLSLKQIINEDSEFLDLLLFLSLIDSQNIPKDLLLTYSKDTTSVKFMNALRKFSLVVNSSDSDFSIHKSSKDIMYKYFLKTLAPEFLSEKLKKFSRLLENHISDESLKYNYQTFHLASHIESFLNLSGKLVDKVTIGNLRSSLGLYYYHVANFNKAKEHLEHALDIFKECYGTDHIKTAWIMARLGPTYRNLGDDKHAKDLLEQALKVSKKYNGSEHIETIRIYTYLGSIYRSIGDYKKAKDLLEKAFTIYKETYGPYNNNTGKAAAYLGCVYKCLGDYKKAKEFLELAYNIYKKYNGSESVSTGWVGARLGNVYLSLGDYDYAEELIMQSLNIYKKYDSENSLEAAWYMVQLSKIYKEKEDYSEALRLIKKSIDIYNTNLVSTHIVKAWANIHLAEVYVVMKEYKQAKELLLSSHNTYVNYYGFDHLKTAGVELKLAKLYFNEQNLDKAEKYGNNALNIMQKADHNELYSVWKILADINLMKSQIEKNIDLKKHYLNKHNEFNENLNQLTKRNVGL